MEVGDRVRFSRPWLRRNGLDRDALFLRTRGTVQAIGVERRKPVITVRWDGEDALDEYLIRALAMAHDKRPTLAVIRGGRR